MSEYIEREKTIKPICEACNKQFPEEPCEPSDCTIMQMLCSIPAADVREVKRGKWKAHEAYKGAAWGFLECSVCGGKSWTIKHNFCPNCGAKMEES